MSGDEVSEFVTEKAPLGEYDSGPLPKGSSTLLAKVLLSLAAIGSVVAVIVVSISTFATTALPCANDIADIVFLLDESGSIDQEAYLNLLGNISTFVSFLPIEEKTIRVGVVEFSNFTENPSFGNNVINLYDHESVESLQTSILALGHSGGFTEVAAALRYLRTVYFNSVLRPSNIKEGAKRFIIYIGDGTFTGPSPLPEMELLKSDSRIGDFTLVFLPIPGKDGTYNLGLFDSLFEDEPDRYLQASLSDYSEVREYLIQDLELCIR